MHTVIFTAILVGAVYLTTEIFGDSCEDKSLPTMREIASCCHVDQTDTPSPKQKEMEQSAKMCFEAHRNEYRGLSDEEVKQKGGKFGEYNCISECIYKKIGILNEDGALDKKKFSQTTKESFPEEFKEPATRSMTKCLDKTGLVDMCSQSSGILQLSKCFMAEMVLNCPEKHFNDTEVCRNGRQYLTDCADNFSKG